MPMTIKAYKFPSRLFWLVACPSMVLFPPNLVSYAVLAASFSKSHEQRKLSVERCNAIEQSLIPNKGVFRGKPK